jgi:hypothetical protein
MQINASALEDKTTTNYDPCLTLGPLIYAIAIRFWTRHTHLLAAMGVGTGAGLSRSHGDDGAIEQNNEPLAGTPGPSELHSAR